MRFLEKSGAIESHQYRELIICDKSNGMAHIAIVEDDLDIAKLIQIHLEESDHSCVLLHNGSEALDYLLDHRVDAVVLDINLPEVNGIEICTKLRLHQYQTPILMLTARGEESDKVEGLENGADDYMTKPFSVRELTARIKALLRRADPLPQRSLHAQTIRIKDLEINPLIHKVSRQGSRIDLTPKEFDLLYTLASRPGVTLNRNELLHLVWGAKFDGFEHTVNSHINRLRLKIERNAAKPEYILTTWGVGYRFNDA